MISEEKKILRLKMAEMRAAMEPETKVLFDEAICSKLKKLTLEIQSEVVHVYIPLGDEIDTTAYITWCLEKGIKVICPKVVSHGKLVHLELTDLHHLEKGVYGTQHPAGNRIYTGDIDMILLPGLGFDKEKNRLGYGGGFYDRFLPMQKKAKKIAALYPFQFVDRVPVESHDEKMDQLVFP